MVRVGATAGSVTTGFAGVAVTLAFLLRRGQRNRRLKARAAIDVIVPVRPRARPLKFQAMPEPASPKVPMAARSRPTSDTSGSCREKPLALAGSPSAAGSRTGSAGKGRSSTRLMANKTRAVTVALRPRVLPWKFQRIPPPAKPATPRADRPIPLINPRRCAMGQLPPLDCVAA